MYGKQTLALVRKDVKLAPIVATPNFNSHMSVIPPKEKDDLEVQFDHSQIYLYELDGNKMGAKRPRHCLPYAVVTWVKLNDGTSWPFSFANVELVLSHQNGTNATVHEHQELNGNGLNSLENENKSCLIAKTNGEVEANLLISNGDEKISEENKQLTNGNDVEEATTMTKPSEETVASNEEKNNESNVLENGNVEASATVEETGKVLVEESLNSLVGSGEQLNGEKEEQQEATEMGATKGEEQEKIDTTVVSLS